MPPLTILEEFLLLAHDEEGGQFYPLSRSVLDSATAGAILMDLMLRRRVDYDLRHIFIIDPLPLDDDLLDSVLQMMALAPILRPLPVAHWVHHIAEEGEGLRERAIERLETRGILKREEKKILWIFSAERYPILQGTEIHEVRQRLKDIILKNELPLPHDIMLTALVEACGLFHHIFDSKELAISLTRIEQVVQMDLVGQAVAKAATEIETVMAMASGFR